MQVLQNSTIISILIKTRGKHFISALWLQEIEDIPYGLLSDSKLYEEQKANKS